MLFGCFLNVNICISGGNTSARALLANAPTNGIRLSRSGILRANEARMRKKLNNGYLTA